ncbi:hypothetical protein KEM56_005607 [Ascosphaera pollenicola]|nr:hypothetical protein KEM56_005607 [Ascosphaera pollenicola]
MQDASNQQNWDELYAAIELLNRSKKELVDFAVEGLKVHRRALDEELEWLYERFGNEQGSAGGGGDGGGNGKGKGKGKGEKTSYLFD